VNLLAASLAPLLLLVPAVAAGPDAPVAERQVAAEAPPAEPQLVRPPAPMSRPETFEDGPWQALAIGFLEVSADQVRIDQSLTIRVSPRAPAQRPIALTDRRTVCLPG
jgi:hypothetical protein